jgi:hypothetical protein
VYPNPSTGIITIQGINTGSNEALSLNIYNTLGQRVYTQGVKASTVQLDLNSLDKGIYFIQLLGGKEAFSQKIILE